MQISLENLLERSNRLAWKAENEITNLDESLLQKNKNGKGWNTLEVIDHLNAVYQHYLPKLEKAINQAPNNSSVNQSEKHSLSFFGKMMINSMTPTSSRKRKFKMNTFGDFHPGNSLEGNSTISEYLNLKETFNQLLKESRNHYFGKQKVNSAIGPIMKFYVVECFAFLIAHEERHFLQIEEIINSQQESSSVNT